MKTIVTLAAVALALCGVPAEANAQEFQLVVNASNSVSQLSRDQVSKIFRKKDRSLGGQSALPVDLNRDAPVRGSFSQAIHGQSTNADPAPVQVKP